MKSKDERKLAQEVILELLEPLIALGDLWAEAGNEMVPGWRRAAISLKIDSPLQPETRAFIRTATGMAGTDDHAVEAVIIMLIGFRLSILGGISMRDARPHIAASMREMLNIASALGMGKREAEDFIHGHMEMSRFANEGGAS